jgi:hypothetical protein
MNARPITPAPSIFALQAAFSRLLPRIRRHAEFAFRNVRCENARADFVAETVGLAWKTYLILARRGRDAGAFVTPLARRCARAVKNGRRLHRAESGQDALALSARRRCGFTVESLPSSTALPHEGLHGVAHGQNRLDAFEERLCDNTQTPVPEQVALRLDFPAWCRTQPERTRRILGGMLAGERTRDLSQKFGISPACVSQLRRQLHNDWARFCGEGSRAGQSTAVAVL